MCLGGGNSATKAADRAEKERQTRISGNVASINSAYAGREPQYADFVSALRQKYTTDLARQQGEAGRQLKFSLARGGLTGGSAAIDAGTEFSREAAQGTISAEQQARGKLAELQGQDEQSRLGMISLAQSGQDIGNAAMQTANALRANIAGAQSAGLAQGLGDIFGNTAAVYKKQQDAEQFRRGMNSTYAKPFGT